MLIWRFTPDKMPFLTKKKKTKKTSVHAFLNNKDEKKYIWMHSAMVLLFSFTYTYIYLLLYVYCFDIHVYLYMACADIQVYRMLWDITGSGLV